MLSTAGLEIRYTTKNHTNIFDLGVEYELLRQSNWNMTVLPLTIYISILMVVGLVGNILVITVFFYKSSSPSRSTSSRLSGHQHHGRLVVSLAVTDLVVCAVSMPGQLARTWYLLWEYDFFCKSWELIHQSTLPISAVILVAIAYDRYRLICRPTLLMTPSQSQRVYCLTMVIAVVIGTVFSVPVMLFYGVYKRSQDGSGIVYTGLCEPNDLIVSKNSLTVYVSVLVSFYIVVLCLLFIAYSAIVISVWRHATSRKQRCKDVTTRHTTPCLQQPQATNEREGKLMVNNIRNESNTPRKCVKDLEVESISKKNTEKLDSVSNRNEIQSLKTCAKDPVLDYSGEKNVELLEPVSNYSLQESDHNSASAFRKSGSSSCNRISPDGQPKLRSSNNRPNLGKREAETAGNPDSVSTNNCLALGNVLSSVTITGQQGCAVDKPDKLFGTSGQQEVSRWTRSGYGTDSVHQLRDSTLTDAADPLPLLRHSLCLHHRQSLPFPLSPCEHQQHPNVPIHENVHLNDQLTPNIPTEENINQNTHDSEGTSYSLSGEAFNSRKLRYLDSIRGQIFYIHEEQHLQHSNTLETNVCKINIMASQSLPSCSKLPAIKHDRKTVKVTVATRTLNPTMDDYESEWNTHETKMSSCGPTPIQMNKHEDERQSEEVKDPSFRLPPTEANRQTIKGSNLCETRETYPSLAITKTREHQEEIQMDENRETSITLAQIYPNKQQHQGRSKTSRTKDTSLRPSPNKTTKLKHKCKGKIHTHGIRETVPRSLRPKPDGHKRNPHTSEIKETAQRRPVYRAHVKAAIMFLLLSATFLVSYLPVFLTIVGVTPAHHLLHNSYLLHSALNPILYSATNKNFRTSVKLLFR